MCIHSFEWLWSRAIEIDLAIRVIFYDGHLVAASKQEQTTASFGCHNHSGWIMKGGRGINKAGRAAGQNSFQQVHTHTILVCGNADNPGSQGAKCLDSAQICRGLNDDFIALIEQETSDQANPLC